MAVKRVHKARITHIGRLPVFAYGDKDELVSITETVQIITQVTDGPDAGREIRTTHLPEEIPALVQRLQEAAESAVEHRGE